MIATLAPILLTAAVAVQTPRLTAAVAVQAQTQAPAPESATRAKTTVAEARRLIDQGQARAAIDKLKAAGEPAPVEVAHLLGVAYYHADDHMHAIEQLASVLPKLPEGSLERREAMQIIGL